MGTLTNMPHVSLLWKIILSFFLGISTAQKVTQPQPAMFGKEGDALTLTCTYETSDSNYGLFWYKQPSSGELILLIRQDGYSQKNARAGRYSVNFQKSNKSISLTISASQLGDSAIYFCAYITGSGNRITFGAGTKLKVTSGVNSEDEVTQSPQTLSIQEGAASTIYCNYSSSSSDYLHWYRQDMRKNLVNLFSLVSNGAVKHNGRLRATLNTKDRHSSLNIRASQPGDSAIYFCARRRTGGSEKLTFGSGTYLTVQPNIQNPQPALYQLRSPKSSNTSVCLLTDFGFYNGSIKNETVTGSEATVLEMMTMESKSYGAVTWGSKSNFTCTDAFRKDMFDFNQFSGSKCNSSHAEQGFETDRDLNLMNLSLIVLRIIFLKTVGFNLLMTLRLWSN